MAVSTVRRWREFVTSVLAEFRRALDSWFVRVEADHAFVPAVLSSELRTTEGTATCRVQVAHDDAVRCAEAQVVFKFAYFRVVKESYRSCIRGAALNGKRGCCGRGCRCRSVRPHVQEDMFVIGGALVSRRRPVLSIHKVFARVTEFLTQLVHHLFHITSTWLLAIIHLPFLKRKNSAGKLASACFLFQISFKLLHKAFQK